MQPFAFTPHLQPPQVGAGVRARPRPIFGPEVGAVGGEDVFALAEAAEARADSQARSYRSSGRSPVRLATRANMRGPISSRSWNANT